MAKINRKYYLNEHYRIDEKARRLYLLPDFFDKLKNKQLNGRGFKKIGGSTLGDVLLTDRFKSQFAAFCNVANLGLPILDEKYVNAGRIIEPKITAVLAETTHKKIEVFPAEKYNFDYFADKDEVLGGVPDGFIASDNTIIEIKTTNEKNYPQWIENGVPLNYQKQAAQYSYLMGAQQYVIAAAFLKEEDYAHPETFPVQKRKIKTWKFKLDPRVVADDITKIKTLYHEWTSTGVSPVYNPVIDADLLAWLNCANKTEWEALKTRWIAEGKYVV